MENKESYTQKEVIDIMLLYHKLCNQERELSEILSVENYGNPFYRESVRMGKESARELLDRCNKEMPENIKKEELVKSEMESLESICRG